MLCYNGNNNSVNFNFAVFVIENYNSFAIGDYGLSPEKVASMEATGVVTGRARRSSVIRLYDNIFVSDHRSKEVEAVYNGTLGEFQ